MILAIQLDLYRARVAELEQSSSAYAKNELETLRRWIKAIEEVMIEMEEG